MEIEDLIFTGWTLEDEINPNDVGDTIIVKATHTNGNWAMLLLTVVGRDEVNSLWDVELETVLDGSEGILEGYLGSE